jgi:hypothetical protein
VAELGGVRGDAQEVLRATEVAPGGAHSGARGSARQLFGAVLEKMRAGERGDGKVTKAT